jgi:outer membrane protein OmpA-like peptidoglycan-associated protein
LAGWAAAAVVLPAVLAAVGTGWVRAPAGVAPAAGPGTVAVPNSGGARPDGAGAQVAALLATRPLLFDGERADLRPDTAEAVGGVAEMLARAPQEPVRLVGHTADLPGPPDRAVALSRQRAEVVAAALAAAGIDRSRITVDGVGDAEPLGTPEASRRVEVIVGGAR